MKRLTIVMLSLMLISTLNFSKALCAQTDKATLTPEAEAALNSGLAAARQQQWDLAIKYFKQAQEAAPLAPETIFNLALAYDKAEGHDLFAAAYYRTYLAAVPEAEDKDKIRSRIDELLISAEANANKFIRKTEDAYNAICKTFGSPNIIIAEGERLSLKFMPAKLQKLAAARVYMGDWNKDSWRRITEPWDEQIRSKKYLSTKEWEEAKNSLHLDFAAAMRETGNGKALKRWIDSNINDDETRKKYDMFIKDEKDEYPTRVINGSWMMAKGDKRYAPEQEQQQALLEREPEHWLDFIGWFSPYYMREDASGREVCVDSPQYWEGFPKDIEQSEFDRGGRAARRLLEAAHGMAFGIYHLRAMDEYYLKRHAEK
jgi:CRISPR/Cas system CMR-associated protein Cmr5 small subunit